MRRRALGLSLGMPLVLARGGDDAAGLNATGGPDTGGAGAEGSSSGGSCGAGGRVSGVGEWPRRRPPRRAGHDDPQLTG